MTIIQMIILAIIEGLTEFLPISSTGHMILAVNTMKLHDDAFVMTFEIAIQFGAILAIVSFMLNGFLKLKQFLTVFQNRYLNHLRQGVSCVLNIGLVIDYYMTQLLFHSIFIHLIFSVFKEPIHL